jgi:soluble lytic murein transglycosylase-like protein
MRICLITVCLAGLLGAAETPVAPAADATVVVRADPRTGRLVRRVVVNPKVVPPRRVSAKPATSPRPQGPEPPPKNLREAVDAAARKHHVDPHLAHSVAHVESGYNPYAISHRGAEGVMQLMPATARRLGVTNTFDWRQNIEAGVRHLKYLQEKFGDDRLALAAYNAGEGAVARHGWVPPYAETQSYVYQVGRRIGELKRSASARPAGPEVPEAAQPGEPEHRPLEAKIDSEGRLILRTK